MGSKKVTFPAGFVWGAASASFQIEGGVKEDGRGESIWDRMCKTPGRIENGFNGDIACDSYHKYKEDVKALNFLGAKAYRFSIAWPRIMPSGKGKVNEKGVDYYKRVADELLKNGITPYATLYHWDLPQVLEDKGGWVNRDTAFYFYEYAREVTKRLSDRIGSWMTLNEPPCSAYLGYLNGEHAPGKKLSRSKVNQVIHNLLLAHGLGVAAVREASYLNRVGIAFNPDGKVPKTNSKADIEAAKKAFYYGDWVENGWWMDPMYLGKYPADIWKQKGKDVPAVKNGDMEIISAPMDYTGFNYYSSEIVEADPKSKKGYKVVPFTGTRTSMGWAIIPDTLYWGLKIPAERYKINEIYITENGCAFADTLMHDDRIHDLDRIDFLKRYLTSLNKVIKDGVNVKGYFQWCLMDNFEWALGYNRRFGLFHTDYSTQKRTPKNSAYFYKKLIKEGEFKV